MEAESDNCPNSNLVELIQKWGERINRAQKAHYINASKAEWWNNFLMIANIILTAITTGFLFSTFGRPLNYYVASLGLSAVIVSALQGLMRLQERAQRHVEAGVAFGRLSRDVERLRIATATKPSHELEIDLTVIQGRWDSITQESPMVWRRIWESCLISTKGNDPTN